MKKKGATTVNAYFPNTTWYKYETGQFLNVSASPYVTLDAPLNQINVHIRGGYVIPYQIPSVTTSASRKNPFGLVVALDQSETSSIASGELFWDDGQSADSISNQRYNLFSFIARNVGKYDFFAYESILKNV